MRRPGLCLIILIVLFCSLSGRAQTPSKEMQIWLRGKNKPSIKEIAIEGNTFFSDNQIRGQMYSKTRSFWRSLKGDRRIRLHQENLGRDTLEIKYIYFSKGFMGVEIAESFERLEDASALIRVKITEGKQYFFGQSEISGSFDSKFTSDLTKISRRLKEREPANPLAIRQAVFELKTYLANRGYPYAEIEYNVDTASSPPVARVRFFVESDSLVKYGQIAVEGTANYPEKVARRELKIKPGEVYKRDDIIDSQRRLFEAGYFSLIRLEQDQQNGDRLRPDFLLKVRERKPHYANISAGAGQSDVRDLQWSFSGGVGKRNFMASRKIYFDASYSFSVGHDSRLIGHTYTTRYTEPWFLGIRMPLTFAGSYSPPLRSTLQDYDISSWTASVSTTRRFGDEIKTVTGLEYEQAKITGVPAEQADSLRRLEEISIRRKVYTDFRLDSRDNLFVPRRGSLTDISVDYFGGFLGGDDSFYKIDAAWSTYQIVWPGWILAVRLKGGYADVFGDSEEIPKEELLYLGGANTIRGFLENSLGPRRADGSAEGSHMTFIFNQEFRWQTVQILNFIPVFRSLPQWQSLFIDMGNGFRNSSDIKWEGLAFSYGTGFQIISPAGPIRVDYARVIPTPNYSFDSRWHFTILYSF